MQSFWGLMAAYWLSDRWKEAWGLTFVIASLTALSSKTSVWLAEASGSLINSIAQFHHPENLTPLPTLLYSAGVLMALVVFKDAGIIGVRHLFSTTLHRMWRRWLDGRFNEALLDGNHTHFHVQHATRDGEGASLAAPDNIDQRVLESIKAMTGGAIGLAMGVLSVVTALFFVGQKLLETSTEVAGLEFLGAYGSCILALIAVVIYVPINTYMALKLGGMLQRLNVRMQKAEGSYRSEFTTLLRRGFHVAAARGEAVQRQMHQTLYKDIHFTWGRLNRISAGYLAFEKIYDFMAARIIAYAPGLIPYMHGRIDLKGYVTGAELVNSLISQCSWFIHVMPEIASLKANAARVTELAKAIEGVQEPQDFYRRTGISEFRYSSQHSVFGLTIRNLELMHEGSGPEPFLKAGYLRFRPGEWTFINGESGCGKTSVMKAINGLWPHGRGDVIFPQGVTTIYAAQDVKLAPVSLKSLVCLPGSADGHGDVAVAAALHKAGLGEFIEHLHEQSRADSTWDQLLSGGQKQRLVLARIVLQQPGLLFLDEASGALDPEARTAFHQTIKDNCPDVTVISVMHETIPPRNAMGEHFYDSVLTIADGTVAKNWLSPGVSPQLTSLLKERRLARKMESNGR
jgi:putative ATP-binding cassette transporter